MQCLTTRLNSRSFVLCRRSPVLSQVVIRGSAAGSSWLLSAKSPRSIASISLSFVFIVSRAVAGLAVAGPARAQPNHVIATRTL